MKNRRFAYAILVFTLTLITTALPSFGQKARNKPSSSKATLTPSAVVATVNGENLYWADIADELIDDQLARMTVTQEMFKDNRPVLGQVVGLLALKKLAASGGQSATLTRAEIKNFLFKEKSAVVSQAIDSSIQEKVLLQAAKAKHVFITDADIKKKMASSIDQVRKSAQQSGGQLTGLGDQQVLKAIGFRESFLRRNVTNFLLLEKLAAIAAKEKFGHEVGPGDFVDASHILVMVRPANDAEKEKAFADGLKKITGFADEIKSGKTTFEESALRNSDDSSKMQSGKLGVFMRGRMVPEFDKVAFGLEAGKVSEPVRTQFGWHLIKINRLGKDCTPDERSRAMQDFNKLQLQTLLQSAKIVNKFAPTPTQQGMGMPPAGR